MKDIFEKLAACKRAYPEDAKTIEAEELRIQNLLAMKGLAETPEVQQLIGMCRRQIVDAKLRLCSARNMDQNTRDGIWVIIESRQWVIQMLAKDFEGELTQIERELEAEMRR